MSQQPLVEQLEHRTLYAVTPNDSGFPVMYDLRTVYASKAWERGTGNMNVIVAGIDTGIDYTHPDLYANIWINQGEIPKDLKKLIRDVDKDGRITFYDLNSKKNRSLMNDVNANGIIDAGDLLTRRKSGGWVDGVNGVGFLGDTYVDDIIGWDFANNDNNPFDYDGHGTHTAGTIAAQGNNNRGTVGIAWRASLMALKIFDDSGVWVSDARAAKAIMYAANAGARVSNNSWGALTGGFGANDAIYSAIKYAATKNHTFVAAAGNDGFSNSFFASMPSSYPEGAIVSVAALGTDNNLAFFSNAGTGVVDLAAPGEQILSTYRRGSYEYLDGTSMAAPHVAGTIALMLSINPNLTPAEIKSDLMHTSTFQTSLQNQVTSNGYLDVADAVYVAAVRRTLDRGGDPGLQTVLINGNTVTASGFTRHLYNILVANDPNYDPNGPV